MMLRSTALTRLIAFAALTLVFACGDESRDDSPSRARTTAPPQRDDGLGPLEGVVDLSRAATLRLRLTFSGDPAAPSELDQSRDGWCATNHRVFDESLVVAKDGGLAHVLVWLEGLSEWRESFPAPPDPVEIRQSGCRYEPHALALRAGQPLRVVNADDTSHNVQILAKVNPETNFTQHQLNEIDTITLVRPERSMPLVCAFHPWMKGWLHVFDHPGFGLTGADGALTISGLPPGKYRLHFWHERLRSLPSPREVELAPAATLDLGTLSVPR